MRRKAINAILVCAVFILLPIAASADVPDWLRDLAKQPAKSYADDVEAVVLLNNQVTTVKENGEIVVRVRYAIKVLRPEGRRYAIYPVVYDNDSKVNYLHGWSITNKGQEYEAKDKDIFEQSVTTYEVYSDTKVKELRVPGTDVGAVVGIEYERNKRPYIYQDFWDFQWIFPVEQSRYELHLAPGWRVRTDWVNHEEKKPVEDGGALMWKLEDIPRIEREPHRPPSQALAGRMVVTLLSDKMPAKTYKNWGEFGSWYSQLAAGARDPSPALQQKAQEIAPSTLPLLERIKAVSRFAQRDVRYVAIEIGVGGYRPHTAAEVFTHRYGDCKDKATVLSSMLNQIGVKSYYVLVHVERGTFQKNSPAQARFDHMILAIALPNVSYNQPMPAMYEHPELGHLLIFDPTNDFVPFGQIPHYEQDNYGLLVTDKGGEYIHLPLAGAENNGVTRTARLKLLPDGTLQGEVDEIHKGFEAMRDRMYLQHETDKDRKKTMEHFLGRSVSNFQVDSFELVNTEDIDKDFIIRYKFTAERYAKSAGPLLLVRPRVLGELAGNWDANKPRHYAYDFPAPFLDSDKVEITLPDGLKVDEVPEPLKASFPFAEYTSRTEAAGNLLKYSREYKMATTEVPFAQVDQVKKLFGQINADEKNTVVLKKVN